MQVRSRHAAENKCSKLRGSKSNALSPHPYNDLNGLTRSGLLLPPPFLSLAPATLVSLPFLECTRHPQSICNSFFFCILLERSPPDIHIAHSLTPSGLGSNVTFLEKIPDSPLEICNPFHALLHWDSLFYILFYLHVIYHYLDLLHIIRVYLFIVLFPPPKCRLSETEFFLVCFFGVLSAKPRLQVCYIGDSTSILLINEWKETKWINWIDKCCLKKEF